MRHASVPYHEVRLYIGSKRGYNGPPFSRGELFRKVSQFQSDWKERYEWTVALRVSECYYLVMDYMEVGHELAAINYPRFPREREELNHFMAELREHLLIEFGQNRITVVWDDMMPFIDMMEHPNAEQHHKAN